MINKKDQVKRLGLFGGDDRDRTDYLLNAIQALSQVSYTPDKVSIAQSCFLCKYYPKNNRVMKSPASRPVKSPISEQKAVCREFEIFRLP